MAMDKRPIVLVVDDEESVRRSFEMIFQDDYEVVTATLGEEALEKVRDLMPNLMFLDIRMPGMNGLEVLARAREIDPNLEVVMVTAVSEVSTAIEAMKLGAFNYVVKPFDVDEMQRLASRALDKHRINLENRRFLESLTQKNVRLRIQRNRLKRRLEATSQALQEMRDGITQVSKFVTLGEAATTLAHEIRNPLSTISSYVQLARLNLPPGAQVFPHLDRMDREIQRLNRIVENLMSYSSRSRPEWSRVEVNELIEETLWLVRPKANAQGIEVITRYATPSPTVEGHPDQLTQVFLNLFVNACQAMPGGGRLEITTGLTSDGAEEQVVVRIADTGCGIREEHLPHIFKPFYTTRGKEGTGLGLAISSQIVSDHHGSIDVQSEVERGSVFVVALPSAAHGLV